jgi:hypothetical protein
MHRDLYTEHFKFSERSFARLPGPEAVFWPRASARAVSVRADGRVRRGPLTAAGRASE